MITHFYYTGADLYSGKPYARAIRGNMLVVDDDATFAAQLQKVATREGFMCDAETDVNGLVLRMPLKKKFDVIVIDYDLIDYKGTVIASLFPKTPVVLVSSSLDWLEPDTECSQNTVGFVSKRDGLREILREANRAMCFDPFLRRNEPYLGDY